MTHIMKACPKKATCFAIPLEGATATVAAPVGRRGLAERRETT